MIARAKIKYLKISPRKLRLVLPLIKNKNVPAALSILQNTNKKAARFVYKAVHSAAANAKRLPHVNEADLYIARIFADGGPMLKRFRAMPMGTAGRIRKRTSHLTVELDTLMPAAKPATAHGRKTRTGRAQKAPKKKAYKTTKSKER